MFNVWKFSIDATVSFHKYKLFKFAKVMWLTRTKKWGVEQFSAYDVVLPILRDDSFHYLMNWATCSISMLESPPLAMAYSRAQSQNHTSSWCLRLVDYHLRIRYNSWFIYKPCLHSMIGNKRRTLLQKREVLKTWYFPDWEQ